jgi:hypothetical protein
VVAAVDEHLAGRFEQLLAALAAGKPPTAPAGTAATRRSRGLALVGVGEISHRTSSFG